jgi:hypothetical protein
MIASSNQPEPLPSDSEQRLAAFSELVATAISNAASRAQLAALARLSRLEKGLRDVLEGMREIAAAFTAILSEGGLGPALKSLARRFSLPVELEVSEVERLPEPVEVAAYYVVSEALANAAKHARASVAQAKLAVVKIIVVYLTGSAVASASPTPGGLGMIEAALVAGLTALGAAAAPTVAGVLAYRLLSCWLTITPASSPSASCGEGSCCRKVSGS